MVIENMPRLNADKIDRALWQFCDDGAHFRYLVPYDLFIGNAINRIADRDLTFDELVEELLHVVDDCRDRYYCFFSKFALHPLPILFRK